MAHVYKHLKPPSAAPHSQERPAFGRRQAIPDIAPPRRRGASTASKAFCAAAILYGIASLVVSAVS